VRLHVDPGPGDAVLDLPAWIRPKTGEHYWHSPRSARRQDDGRLSVTVWCGPHRWARDEDLTDREPRRRICAGCYGRMQAWAEDARLIFRPRDHFGLPTWCPGRDEGAGICTACGERVSYRYRGGGMAECRHRPRQALLNRYQPCPNHGWLSVDETMVCRDGDVYGDGSGCGFDTRREAA